MSNESIITEPSILKKLFENLKNRQPLHLINVYQGIPIRHDAKITMISQGYIILNVHPRHAVCIAIEKYTYIQSKYFDHTYKAHLAAIDVPAREVMVVHLLPAENDLDKRTALRVQPKEPLPVKLFLGNYELSGVLADLSPQGIGLFTFWAYINSNLEFQRDDEVYVELSLPNRTEKMRLRGKITYTKRESENVMYRLGVQTSPDYEANQILTHYIEQRKAEILEELDRKYDTMCLADKD
jgi:hypothetical protein